MLNFEYVNRTKLVFGKGVEQDVGRLTKQFGTKVLLHYGSGSIKKHGLYAKVIDSLQGSNIDFVELGGVIANPSLMLVQKGIELCRKERIDFILAVGGGSVIDSAKAIAMGVFYDGDIWDVFVHGAVPQKALPIGVVLTIPAAGSESSVATVITNYDAKLKRSVRFEILRPVFAIMNPELTYTLPAHQTAVGAIDMIGHVMERYFTNTPHVETTDRLCESVMRTVVNHAPVVMKEPNNYDSRAEIMLCGALAHNGLLGVGREEDWASHMMEYEITQESGIAHAHGLAILYPAWMRYVYRQDVARFARFAHVIFDVPQSDDLEAMALAGIEKLESFYHSLGITTTLREVGLTEADIHRMAAKATKNGTITLGRFVPLTMDDVIRIYQSAL